MSEETFRITIIAADLDLGKVEEALSESIMCEL
jgi:hypothetical protein